MSKEQFAPTTKEIAEVLEITGTPGASSTTGIAQAIKSGVITPEQALKVAEDKWAKSNGRKFAIPSVESRSQQLSRATQERQLFERNKQPFIFPGFTPENDFYLSQGLNLIGARSGHSKSTTAANILAGILEYRPDTTVLVISNEELTDAILHRTACVLLQKSYMRFHQGNLSPREADEVRRVAYEILERLIVVNDPAWDTTCYEDVKAILEGAAAQGVNAILIDYYQTITHSKNEPELEQFQVLKKFGQFMLDYGKRCPVPVAVLCQLGPKSTAPEFQARVQNDKTIYNHAFNVVEIEPDFETKLTTFTIHKQRFGLSQGAKVVLRFNQGRYEQEGGL